MTKDETTLPTPSARQLICQYIIETRGQGLFLSYTDYEVVDRWLSLCGGDEDILLFILSEVLPSYYRASSNKSFRSLKALEQNISKRITDFGELSFQEGYIP